MYQESQDDRIERILESVDGIERARANPFLFARVMNRMQATEAKSEGQTVFNWGVALAMVILLIANVITIASPGKRESRSKGEDAVATEYSIQLANSY